MSFEPINSIFPETNYFFTQTNIMTSGKKISLFEVFFGFFEATVLQSVLEYYWHRLMHLPVLYRSLHKLHHFYKLPEVWDDMYIHPLEAVGYYCLLYSPPFLLPLHYCSFLLYMGLVGLLGVLDHCGGRIRLGLGLRLPLVGYDSLDHARHHLLFNCNFAFPFPAMDLIHKTYYKENT
jgi:sterol desaturase/sphingolipid hydroxylase (fatty acid hydroxylase superfamily)